jgi:hypothetical protein|nr:MAG TPA: hypothetical protein [Caudoviricetes sp.]
MKKLLKKTRKIRLKIHFFGIKALTWLARIVLMLCLMVDDFDSLLFVPIWLGLTIVSAGWLLLVDYARG